MKNFVTKAAVIVCLLSPVLASATSTTETTSITFNAGTVSNATVGYSWTDFLVTPKNGTPTEQNGTLNWTLAGPTASSGTFSDPSGTLTGGSTLSFTSLSAGTYTLTLSGTWTYPSTSSGLLINTPGSVHLNDAVVTAVPEPESYAMLLAGLGLVGTIAIRRRNQNNA